MSGEMDPWRIQQLAACGDDEFHSLVVPLSRMVRLTYTATHGSYFNASDADATVEGWERDLLRTADPSAGMRALLFVQRPTRRAVVAFRGTDLNTSTVSGAADRCADLALAGQRVLPPPCREFSNRTLDYIARALEFVASALGAYPGFAILTTGHSLGASLAMAAASFHGTHGATLPAVGFAAGSWRSALRRRTGFEPPAAAAARRLYALADRWDPVQGSANASGDLLGEVCTWADDEPVSCSACWSGGAPPANWTARAACVACFEATHIYANYLYRLVPGPRPECKAAFDRGR
mmetsp:Transcript_3128/g.7078  ORF Transcript_3128/g.7078 Transcript_3128/m.7078 type:complete len:294 (-) Transcript_3128:335-1216(-)